MSGKIKLKIGYVYNGHSLIVIWNPCPTGKPASILGMEQSMKHG